MNVNIHSVRKALDETVDGLTAIGVLQADGNFVQPTTQQDAQIAALGVQVAEHLGVAVPAKVENLIRMLPFLLEMVK